MTGSVPILVTGAAGIVGRACVAALRRAAFDVVGVSRTGEAGNLALDLSSPSIMLEDSLAKAPFAIVHLAAAVPHDPRYPDTEASAALTRAIDRNVHAAANAWGSKVIYMSTCGLYDRLDPGVKTPASPLAEALGPYFRSKRDGEALFSSRHATILRLAAPVGPGLKPSVVLSRFVERVRAGEDIEIWGTGRREQDFIHADDVAALIEHAVTTPAPGIYNCARGVPVTMIALAEAVIDALGGGAIRLSQRDDPGEEETARYAIEDTQKQFGWAPEKPLAEMILAV